MELGLFIRQGVCAHTLLFLCHRHQLGRNRVSFAYTHSSPVQFFYIIVGITDMAIRYIILWLLQCMTQSVCYFHHVQMPIICFIVQVK